MIKSNILQEVIIDLISGVCSYSRSLVPPSLWLFDTERGVVKLSEYLLAVN